MSNDKIQKIKLYLKENLQKEFISLSTILYTSLVLFVAKTDESLRFYINYQ